MWYVIIADDTPDSLDKRIKHRPAHLARLQALQLEGRLLLAGPFPAIDSEDPGLAGFSGSLIIAEFANLSVAKAWAEDDIFRHVGVYQQVTVRPFRKSLP